MTDFKVVEIDIDFNVGELIKKEQSNISTETHNMIIQAVAEAKKQEELKNLIVKEKKDIEIKKMAILEDIYKKLLDNFREGVPVSTIYDMAKEISATPSGFTVKFKKFLKDEKNDKYILNKINKNRTQYFILLPL